MTMPPLIDERTRVILISSVQWINGLRMDLAAFSQLAQERDCFLIVDAIQQLGTIPVDLSGLRIDFLAAGAQKWLNAPFGTGTVVYLGACSRKTRSWPGAWFICLR